MGDVLDWNALRGGAIEERKQDEVPLSTWTEFKGVSETQRQKAFVFQNLLERRGLTLKAARAGAGKTAIMSELGSSGMLCRTYLGHTIEEPAAVLWLNCDRNRERPIYEKMSRIFRDEKDEKTVERLFGYVPRHALPQKVTADFVGDAVASLRRRSGHTGCVITVIDSLRSAFLMGAGKGAENDSAFTTEVLIPIRSLASEEDLAVVVMSHTTLVGNDVAGSGMIRGCQESYWKLAREPGNNESRLEVWPREEDVYQPFALRILNTPAGFEAVPTSIVGQPAENDPALAKFPGPNEPGMVIHDLCSVLGMKEDAARRLARKLENEKLIERDPMSPRLAYRRVTKA